jgi:hypothetical protein
MKFSGLAFLDEIGSRKPDRLPKLSAYARNRRVGQPERFKAVQLALTALSGGMLGLCAALTSWCAGQRGAALSVSPAHDSPSAGGHRHRALDPASSGGRAGLSARWHGGLGDAGEFVGRLHSNSNSRQLIGPRNLWSLDSNCPGPGAYRSEGEGTRLERDAFNPDSGFTDVPDDRVGLFPATHHHQLRKAQSLDGPVLCCTNSQRMSTDALGETSWEVGFFGKTFEDPPDLTRA